MHKLRNRLEELAINDLSEVSVTYSEDGTERYDSSRVTFTVNSDVSVITATYNTGNHSFITSKLNKSSSLLEAEISSLEDVKEENEEEFLGI